MKIRKMWKGWISRWKRKEPPLRYLQCQRGWVAGGLSEVAGKISSLLSAKDSVPLATTRAIMEVFKPERWSRKCSLLASRPCFVGEHRWQQGSIPRDQQTIRPQVETRSNDSAFPVLPRGKVDPRRLGQMDPTWPRIWIFCSYERTRHSRNH